MNIDKMIGEIEQVARIRSIWRCRTGWGIAYIEGEDYIEVGEEIVYAYYPSLESCIRGEYKIVVEDNNKSRNKSNES